MTRERETTMFGEQIGTAAAGNGAHAFFDPRDLAMHCSLVSLVKSKDAREHVDIYYESLSILMLFLSTDGKLWITWTASNVVPHEMLAPPVLPSPRCFGARLTWLQRFAHHEFL